ncbi:hypothetical protein BGZ54_010499 [Gamsiella multidivaricata]|nr:hypothetical protein BGZ54_010499 [Gamsiella multidivaricata]
MWEDDRIWLPILLEGQDPFYGRMYFKHKPLEESTGLEPSTVTTATTTTVADPVMVNSTTSAVSLSATMATTSFTATQPKSGPFAMFDYHLEKNLAGVPREFALDGTIASFED